MRAGKHDGVGARGPVIDEAGRDLVRDRGVGDRLAASALSANAASCAEPTSVTSQPWPKLRISAWVYSRATVASVPSTETRLLTARPRRPA